MKINKTTLAILLIISTGAKIIAQDSIDYIKIKKETSGLSCTNYDTTLVNQSIKNLLALDTLKISNGLIEYYYDLGMSFYLKAALYKQNELFYQSISCFQKCITIDSTYGDAYHNIALMHYYLKDYEKAKTYIDLYKKYTPEKYRDNNLIGNIEEKARKDLKK
jgi:tetratricopeptide (TPR) repeat protein